jgi:hypothetical protein
MDENNQKIVYFYGLLREFGHPQMDPKCTQRPASGKDIWPNVLA